MYFSHFSIVWRWFLINRSRLTYLRWPPLLKLVNIIWINQHDINELFVCVFLNVVHAFDWMHIVTWNMQYFFKSLILIHILCTFWISIKKLVFDWQLSWISQLTNQISAQLLSSSWGKESYFESSYAFRRKLHLAKRPIAYVQATVLL